MERIGYMIVQKKFYSHSNLTSDCSKIIRDIAVNKEVFTHIVGINRGGLIAGLMLSHYYDIPLVPFHISLRDHKTIENEEVIYDIFKNEYKILTENKKENQIITENKNENPIVFLKSDPKEEEIIKKLNERRTENLVKNGLNIRKVFLFF